MGFETHCPVRSLIHLTVHVFLHFMFIYISLFSDCLENNVFVYVWIHYAYLPKNALFLFSFFSLSPPPTPNTSHATVLSLTHSKLFSGAEKKKKKNVAVT
jgi:hypothetical protein